MHSDAAFGAEVEVYLHRLPDIDMLVLHEPARQARADGNQGDVESAALRRGVARSQAFANILEVPAVARVAGEIPMEVRAHDGPAAPQRPVAIAQTTAGPVLRRRQLKFDGSAGMDMRFPPVELHRVSDAELREPGFYAQRHQEKRRAARFARQSSHTRA